MHDDGYFDEHVAAGYDESSAEMFKPEVVNPVVDFLVGLAGAGRVLELGIGTGRIALPLAPRPSTRKSVGHKSRKSERHEIQVFFVSYPETFEGGVAVKPGSLPNPGLTMRLSLAAQHLLPCLEAPTHLECRSDVEQLRTESRASRIALLPHVPPI